MNKADSWSKFMGWSPEQNKPTYEDLERRIAGLERESFERERSENELKEREESLRSIFSSMDDMVFVLDKDGIFTEYFQPPDRSDLFVQPEAFIGYSYRKVLPPNVSDLFDVAISSVMSLATAKQIEYKLQVPEGVNWYNAKLSARKNAAGEISGIVATVRNITKTKREKDLVRIQRDLAISLGKSTDFYEVLRLCLKAGIEASGLNGGGIYIINPVTGALDLLHHEGLPEEFAVAVSHYEANSPNMQMVMIGNPIYTCYEELGLNLEVVGKDMELKAIAMVPVKHANRIVGSLNVASYTYKEVPQFARKTLEMIAYQIGDAIAQKQAEEKLRHNEKLLSKSQKYANIGSWMFDLKTERMLWSEQLYHIFGRDIDKGVPPTDSHNESYHPDDRKLLQKVLNSTIKKGESFSIEYRAFRENDGELRWLKSQGELERDENGEPYRLIGISMDITDRRQQEEEIKKYQEHLEELVEGRTAELKNEINDRKLAQEEVNQLNRVLEDRVRERTAELDKACEELKELDRMKDSFLSLVSHELRTPLTSIRSFSEILLKYKDEDPETRDEFTAIINSESERLTRLINDVLDLSRIEAGEMLWKDEYLCIKEVIQEAINAQHQLLKQKSLRLNLDFSEELPLVRADRDRIQQVIINLLGNAHKFSLDGGEIRVHAETITTEESNNAKQWLKISVSDKGSGIDKQNYRAIFDKFYQIPNNTLKVKPHGTGLGLPICKKIITHYNGKIWIESGLEGKGSIFSFTLPITANENKFSAG